MYDTNDLYNQSVYKQPNDLTQHKPTDCYEQYWTLISARSYALLKEFVVYIYRMSSILQILYI